ncbi:MAG: HAD hydrolase-like protein [Eggerthellaceae bacterium]|jgi:HAD superfamily phosphatase (TIGR01668 family)|nr:HAD hydrolase-like protein [Eggerthellaceae bacterium]MDR2715211.1 HAD hydrolase-like protein [Coriobacteriaceae bacterium]
MSFFAPDRYFSRISAIDVQKDILGAGFTHVLLDIDNTILTRDTHEIPRDIGFWLGHARDAGLRFCLVSNNWHQGVHDLARRIDLPIVSHAMKPLPPALLRGMGKVGARRASTVMIGDQLITDVIGAHLVGVKAYLVCPLVKQDLRHTLLLRNLERAFIGHLQPEGASCEAGVPEAARAAAPTGVPGVSGGVKAAASPGAAGSAKAAHAASGPREEALCGNDSTS